MSVSLFFQCEALSETIADTLLAQADTYSKSESAITKTAISMYESALNAMEPDDLRRIEVTFRLGHLLSSPLQKWEWEERNLDGAINIYNSILNNPLLPENHFWKFEATFYLAGCYVRKYDHERANELFIKIIKTNADELISPPGYEKKRNNIILNCYLQNTFNVMVDSQKGNNDSMATATNLVEAFKRGSDSKEFKERLMKLLEGYKTPSIAKIFDETARDFRIKEDIAISDLLPDQPFEIKDMRLSRALQLAEHYYLTPISVEFLEEKLEDDGKLITMKNNGMNLKEFLDTLVSIQPEYQWTQIGHAVVVYPKNGAKTDTIIDCTFEATSLKDLYDQIRTRINSVIQKGGPVGIGEESRHKWVDNRFSMQQPIRLEKGRITLRECLCYAGFWDEDLQIQWSYIPGGTSDVIGMHFYVGGRYAGGDNPEKYLEEKAKLLSKIQD